MTTAVKHAYNPADILRAIVLLSLLVLNKCVVERFVRTRGI